MQMNESELAAMYAEAARLQAEGKEDEAKALLIKELPRMPEELQTEIMLEMFTDSLEREVAGQQLAHQIQEDGLAAAKVLTEIEERLKEGGAKGA